MLRRRRTRSRPACPVQPCPTVWAETTGVLQFPVAYRTLHTRSPLELGALAFLFPRGVRVMKSKAFFTEDHVFDIAFPVEIRQHLSSFEEEQGDRADRYRPKDRKAPSPSCLVRSQRNGAPATTCHRHRFSVVQERPRQSAGKD